MKVDELQLVYPKVKDNEVRTGRKPFTIRSVAEAIHCSFAASAMMGLVHLSRVPQRWQ